MEKINPIIIDTKTGYGVSSVRVNFNMSAIFQVAQQREKLHTLANELQANGNEQYARDVQRTINLLDTILEPAGLGKATEDIFADGFKPETSNCKKAYAE